MIHIEEASTALVSSIKRYEENQGGLHNSLGDHMVNLLEKSIERGLSARPGYRDWRARERIFDTQSPIVAYIELTLNKLRLRFSN